MGQLFQTVPGVVFVPVGEELRLDAHYRNTLPPQLGAYGAHIFVQNVADRGGDHHDEPGAVAAPGVPYGLAELLLPAADDVPLLQIGGQHAVKGLVPTPGGIAVVKPTAPRAVEERKHLLHFPHRPHAAGDLPVYTKGVQQAGGVHCGHQIFKKRLSHAHFSSLPGKSKIAGPAYSDAEPACRQAHRQGRRPVEQLSPEASPQIQQAGFLACGSSRAAPSHM